MQNEKFALVLSTLSSFLNLSPSLLSHGFLCQCDICQPPHTRARTHTRPPPARSQQTRLAASHVLSSLFQIIVTVSLENTVLCVNQCLFHNFCDIWSCTSLVSWEPDVSLIFPDPNYVQIATHTHIYVYIYIYLFIFYPKKIAYLHSKNQSVLPSAVLDLTYIHCMVKIILKHSSKYLILFSAEKESHTDFEWHKGG